MIVGNIIKFGYGDICVSSDALTQRIGFQQFKPSVKCGDKIPDDVEFVGEEIILKISYEEYCEFNQQFDNVLMRIISTFSFKGCEFDFSNYNEESVNTCKKNLESAMSTYLLSMAA